MPYRWAGLSLLASAYRPAAATTDALRFAGRVVVPASGTRVVAGDVHIDGDLVVENQAMVLVLSRLTVAGAVVAAGADHSMVAAHDVECRDG